MNNHAELRLKVLELARDMLHNAYVEHKARVHNEWSVKAEVAWKTTQRLIPYPQLPSYFTESEVLVRAHTLWAFVQGDALPTPTAVEPPDPVIMEDVTTTTECDQTNMNDHQMVHHVFEPIQLTNLTPAPIMPDAQPVQALDTLPDATSSTIQKGLKVLPAWMTAKRG